MAFLAKSLLANLWKTFLRVLGVLRRACCCFRRRASNEDLPVYVQDDALYSLHSQVDDLQSWDVWHDEAPLSVTVAQDEPGQEDDFFKDMTPVVQHQKKFTPKQNESKVESLASRFRMDPHAELQQCSELGDLEEGWEDVALKEQRRAMLEQRLLLHRQRNIQMEQRKAMRDKKIMRQPS